MSLWRRIFDEYRRVLLPLTIVLVTNVAVLVLAVLPLRTAVTAAEARVADATRELTEARLLDRQMAQARTSRARAEDELRRFYADVLPRDFATAETTANLWLNAAAENAGLTFKGSRFEWNSVQDSRLSRASARVTLEGPYQSIRRFLYAVETAQEFIVVERVELAQQDSQSSASSMLEVSLLVSTYFLTAPQS